MTMKVLIVDDAALIRNLMREMLDALPCVAELREAVGSHDAVKVLLKWQPDVVTLDLQMPGGSGFEVLRAIKAHSLATTVFVVTSLCDRQTREACLAAGAHFVVDKAFELTTLQQLVTDQTQKHRSGVPCAQGELARPIAQRMRSSLLVGLLFGCLSGCAGEGADKPVFAMPVDPTGSTVSLAWDAVQDPTVYAYYVHYGKQSSGQGGTCTYEESQYVSSTSATILGLDPNTRYYFAVSAYNGQNSLCSNEVSTITPASPV